ncbi:hypothetical protein BSNK01_12930 [Bacillaceae bacterium]
MQPIVPMEPVSSESIPEGEKWIAQIKWDGVRVLTYYDGNHVRLFNRKRRERTHHYPELTDVGSYCVAKSVILDGEVIALGENGKPSFHDVMKRDGIRRLERVQEVKKLVPVHYLVFDLIYYNGNWINRRPFQERSALLTKIIRPQEQVQPVFSHPDGKALFEAIKRQGMEGIVLKRTDAPYFIGEKKDVWLKVKNLHVVTAVIGGFTLRGESMNALLLGLYDREGKLWYIGHAGTGKLSSEEWRALAARLQSAVTAKRPFVNKPERQGGAFWVRPYITVNVKYAGWTNRRFLRQPSVQALADVPAHECRLPGETFH